MRPKFPKSFELFYAIFEGTLDDVVKRLKAGDDANAVSNSGTTPIHHAIQYSKDLDKANALIDTGAVIDIWDYLGQHPLHSTWDDACIIWLLDHNVDPNVTIRTSRTIQVYPVGWTALHQAVYRSSLSTVELLLSRGANPNSQSQDGSTPLHVAARRFILYKRLIRTLIDAGADVNAITLNGRTPLHEVAEHMGRYAKAVSRLLLFRGARVDIPDASGALPVNLVDESPLGQALKEILQTKQS